MTLGSVKDVNVEIRVELGRAQLPLEKLAGMTKGTIIPLDKLCGEPVDVYAAGERIAVGEVVVIDEDFGVRISDLVEKEA